MPSKKRKKRVKKVTPEEEILLAYHEYVKAIRKFFIQNVTRHQPIRVIWDTDWREGKK